MFEIFKGLRIRDWEIQLLKNVLKQLPAEFGCLQEQIDIGLLIGIRNDPNVRYRRRFLYDMKIFEAFKIEKEPSYKITGIKVYDKKSKAQLLYTMYISNGVIGGYSIKGADKFSIDVDRTDIFWFVQIFQEVPNSGH
ncbi:hypothetical protein [Dyadobacter sp. CY312]|uniref:hypothetical protein n=1 Tax=Dyadobacter sp. CY312 TaxID=2907303 RepID=UPI001F3A78FD|nr:hypothetical protein [Dyadobacter sp. CY312]MCE7044639.1 hypothetical protein [Dyadobacter sp. CY312]